jgi:SAM-dependent methyltransferase
VSATSASLRPVPLPRENAYGHIKRLQWIRAQLPPLRRALELGCGTGYMLTLPLRTMGHDVVGIDLDEPSIAYGRRVLSDAGQPPAVLRTMDLRDADDDFGAVIASEVLEHLSDDDLHDVLGLIRAKLPPGGTLLVTVPNGYGWFEFEALLWKTPLGAFFRLGPVQGAIYRLKHRCVGDYVDAAHPSTVADSPHLQRFTRRAIRHLLDARGFEVQEVRGSVLFAGPFSNALLTGIRPLMRLNARLGDLAGPLAAGFYIAARRR